MRPGLIVGIVLVVFVVLLTVARARSRGLPLAGDVVVRCGRGHLFTTLWVAGVSVKAVRLGGVRLQRCPVGRHWSLVTPVDEATLTAEELRQAQGIHDTPIP